ncbi:MAG: septum formation initiator family protein [Patescibacteria group bacterium]
MSIIKKRILAYVVMGISLLISIKLGKDIYKLWHADERLVEAEAELKTARQEQEKLKAEIKKTEDGQWQEEQIRNILKMARPNEQIVIVPDSVKVERVTKAVKAEEENLSNAQKWLKLFVY